MSEICKACGAKIPEGRNICEYCGTAVSKKSNRFCRICGNPYAEGTRYCRKCGTLTGEYATENTSRYRSRTRNPKYEQTQSVSIPAPVSSVGRKSPLAVVIAFVLVFTVLIGVLTAGINRCGGEAINSGYGLTNIVYSEKELSAGGTEVTVSPDSPSAEAGGVILDFGHFNLYGESTLEVKALPQKSDSRTGVTVTAYDFSLSDNESGETVSEFPTLVDITIPCTASPDEYAFVQYYNEETKEWQIIDSTRDYENGTLMFQTTHFSIYGESKMIIGSEFNIGPNIEPTLPSNSFAYIGGYQGPLSEVYFVSADLDKLMDSLDYDTMIEILKSCKVNQHDMTTALMSLGNDTANILDLNASNKLINTILRTESGIEKWSTSIRLVGSALIFAKVAYQLYIGGEAETVAYVNAVNIAEALMTVAGVALGSEALLMMATAVFVSNTIYSLATLEVTTMSEQGYINFNDGLGAVFYAESMKVEPMDLVSLSQAYYIPSGPIRLDRGGKGFARALDAIYIHHKEKPADLQKAVDKLINGYVNCFWDNPNLTDTDRAYYAWYKEGYNEKNPQIWIQPSAAAVQGYKDKFRAKLMSDIKPLMKEFSERVLYDLKLKLRDTIEKEYVPFLNTVITIQAEVNSSSANKVTFDKTVYGTNYYMRFSPLLTPSWVPAETFMTEYSPRARSDTNEIFKSTVYNFLQIGEPIEIELMNENGSDSYKDDFYAAIDWKSFPIGKIVIDNISSDWEGKWTQTKTAEEQTFYPSNPMVYDDPTVKPLKGTVTSEDILTISPYESVITMGGEKYEILYRIVKDHSYSILYEDGRTESDHYTKYYLGMVENGNLVMLLYDGENDETFHDSLHMGFTVFTMTDKNTISENDWGDYTR